MYTSYILLCQITGEQTTLVWMEWWKYSLDERNVRLFTSYFQANWSLEVMHILYAYYFHWNQKSLAYIKQKLSLLWYYDPTKDSTSSGKVFFDRFKIVMYRSFRFVCSLCFIVMGIYFFSYKHIWWKLFQKHVFCS